MYLVFIESSNSIDFKLALLCHVSEVLASSKLTPSKLVYRFATITRPLGPDCLGIYSIADKYIGSLSSNVIYLLPSSLEWKIV